MWPLIGRFEELVAIEDALSRAVPAGIVLSGLAGVGKTRLARESLAAAAGRGARADLIVATRSAASIPFGALAPLLGDLGSQQRPDRFEVLRELLAAITARATDEALVLAVDDAHLLDDSSATLVAQLVGQPNIAVLLTIRSGEPAPDAISALWKDRRVERLELQPLAEDEVDALIASALPGQIDSATAVQLRTRSAGNALLLRELLDDALFTGRLAHADGAWVWSTTTGPGPRLSEIVGARVGNLVGAELALAELVAVGEPVELATVEALLPDAPLSECERRGLLAVTEDDGVVRVRLTHPLYGEVLRDRLPRTEHDRLRRLLADRLEAQATIGSGDILRIATWRLECNEPGHHDVYRRGAVVANRLFDHELAERLARRAMAAAPDLETALLLAESLGGQARFAEADDLLASLSGVNDEQRALIANARIQVCGWGLGDFRRADGVVTEALDQVSDPGWRAYLAAERATLLISAGRVGEGLAIAEPLHADLSLDEGVWLRAMSSVSAGCAAVGRSAEGIAAGQRGLEVALGLTTKVPRGSVWAFSGLINGNFAAGQLGEASRLLGFVVSNPMVLGRETRGILHANLGRLAIFEGRPQAARDQLTQAARDLRAMSSVRLSPCLAQLAEAEAIMGNESAARAALDDAMSARPSGAMGKLLEADLQNASAWVAAVQGRVSEAGQISVMGAEAAHADGRLIFEVITRHEAVRFGRTDQFEQLEQLTSLVDGLWPNACATHARGLHDDDAAALERACEQFEVIGAMLHAAECAAEAARAHERAGLKARSSASSARSNRLLQGCEGARTPALMSLAAPGRLSGREREIAGLAARGLSNKAIADALNINVRTVEGHLYQAFAKLAVNAREDLGPALGDAP